MGRYRNNKDGTLDLIAGMPDTSALANKTDISSIILVGSTNTSGNVISAGTWFYLNGTPCIAKVNIASGATFTEGTNYEEKTVGSALSELNSNYLDVFTYFSLDNPVPTVGTVKTGVFTPNTLTTQYQPISVIGSTTGQMYQAYAVNGEGYVRAGENIPSGAYALMGRLFLK